MCEFDTVEDSRSLAEPVERGGLACRPVQSRFCWNFAERCEMDAGRYNARFVCEENLSRYGGSV